MRIGELAQLTHTRASTIRYYEQIGLLPAPKRINGKQRRYDGEDLERVGFIRRCRALGFTLEQLHQFAGIARSKGPPTEHCREIVRIRLLSVRKRVAELRAVEERLSSLLADDTATAGPATASCAGLAALA